MLYKLKRKKYAIPAVIATAGRVLSTPTAKTGLVIGGGVMDAKSTVKDDPNKEEFNYINNPQQKQYGTVQAVGQIAKGVGKGLWEWGKNNKKSLGGLVTFGAGTAGVTYGVNRYQRKKAEVNSGQREANGLSTGEKAAIGATAAGAGAYTAYRTGISHDNKVKALKDTYNKSQSIYQEAINKAKNINPNEAADKFGRSGANQISHFNNIAKKANADKMKAAADLAKTNSKKLGGLVSNKAWKMGRNGLLVGGAITAAGMLANNSLKQKNNSMAAVGRLASRALNGKTVGQAIKSGEWSNLGKAAGTYVTQGAKSVTKGISNFLTPGKNGASGIVSSVANNLNKQGEYGQKAANFIRNHKTAAGLITAGTIGSATYGVTNAIGEKSVNTIADTLDKKTSNFVKYKNGEV